MGGHFREPLGSFAARVYRIDLGGITQQNAADKGVSSLLNEFGCDREAWQDPVPDNLVMNPFFENQQLLLNPDGWILFPTEGAPCARMAKQRTWRKFRSTHCVRLECTHRRACVYRPESATPSDCGFALAVT